MLLMVLCLSQIVLYLTEFLDTFIKHHKTSTHHASGCYFSPKCLTPSSARCTKLNENLIKIRNVTRNVAEYSMCLLLYEFSVYYTSALCYQPSHLQNNMEILSTRDLVRNFRHNIVIFLFIFGKF